MITLVTLAWQTPLYAALFVIVCLLVAGAVVGLLYAVKVWFALLDWVKRS